MTMRKLILAAGLLALSATTVRAESFPPVTDPMVIKECGTCHAVFYPEMLPRSTWQAILGNLKDHFGEDATISDAATLKRLTDFHTASAADVTGTRQAGKWMEGVTTAPKAITEAPRFIRKHKDIRPEVFKAQGIGSKANCGGCHTAFAKGSFEDNEFSPAYTKAKSGR